MNYGVLGAGRLGTAIARFLGDREEVYLWGRDEALMKRIQFDRTNEVYLPGVDLPYEVRATYDLDHVLNDSDVLVSAVPARGFTDLLGDCVGHLHEMEAFVCGTTGFAPSSGRRLSQEYLECVETLDNYYHLTGPASPIDLVDGRPGNLVLAGTNEHNRDRLREIFHRRHLRVYGSEDLIGHELVGSLSNLLAVVGGLVDGLELGGGTRATLLTRGLHEIKRLVLDEGGQRSTVFGTGGLGGAIGLGSNTESRNFRLGRSLARGEPLEEARSTISGCIESIEITRVAHQRILKGELKAPLLTELYGILHEGLDPFNSIQKISNLKHPPQGG